MVQRVVSKEDAAALAARILAPRTRPLVVISTDPATGLPVIDVEHVHAEVGDVADLVLISTGDVSWQLDQLLPEKTQVYGGAGRSYPADFAATPEPSRSPLRFPGKRATANLIGDVLTQADAAGLFAAKPGARRVRVDGTVKGFAAEGSRAIVEVEGRGMATVWREITFPPFPLDWTLHVSQRVSGELDLDARRLVLDEVSGRTEDLAAMFPHRSVTLAFVKKVSPARAVLQLHPAHERLIRRPDVSPNPHDTVDLLLAVGDVVRVRVIHLSDGELHLSLVDVDDDEPVLPPLALSPGGRPWLQEGRPLVASASEAAGELEEFERLSSAAVESSLEPLEPTAAAVSDAVAMTQTATPAVTPTAPAPVPGPGMRKVVAHAPSPAATAAAPATEPAREGTALHTTNLALAGARAKVVELERRLAEAGADDSGIAKLKARATGAENRLREELAERGALEREVEELRDQQRTATRALREARKSRTSPSASTGGERAERRARWATDEEWLRHEIYLAWVERVAASDRAAWPLGGYVVGPRFADSVRELDAGQFAKAMKAAVDAVTGRIREIPGRELHPLRIGAGAGDPELVRPWDGAKCMRAYIEQHTPAARRLHYWVLPGGGVELGRVVTHDDTEP